MNANYLKYFFTKDPITAVVRNSGAPPRLNLFVFSKNWACQVESLLRSIRDHLIYDPLTVTVLYRATDEQFRAGYEKTIHRYPAPGVAWVEETDFYQNLSSRVMALPPDQMIMFLVDDNIIFKKIDLQFIISKFTISHLFISLRVSRQYRKNDPLPAFQHADTFLEWEWKIQKRRSNNWNYPFSVDGNIYHVIRMQQIMRHITFSAPNSFESAMHDYRKSRWIRQISKGISPVEPVLVNNPLNRVQTEGETWHTDVDPGHINKKYLDGFVIDNARLYDCAPTDAHQDLGLHFTTDKPD